MHNAQKDSPDRSKSAVAHHLLFLSCVIMHSGLKFSSCLPPGHLLLVTAQAVQKEHEFMAALGESMGGHQQQQQGEVEGPWQAAGRQRSRGTASLPGVPPLPLGERGSGGRGKEGGRRGRGIGGGMGAARGASVAFR